MAALVNPAGDLVLDYAYDPFGSETGYQPDNADQWDNPFRYCGEYWDEETETYYLRARQYDPETGRFLSEDTHWNPRNVLYGDDPIQLLQNIYVPDILAIMQGSNLQVYCINNPVKYTDANGESITLATIGNAVVNLCIASIGPATIDGIITGATYAYYGKTFEVGFVNGFASTFVSTIIVEIGAGAAVLTQTPIYAYGAILASGPLGAAAGSLAEDSIFNKEKSPKDKAKSAAQAAANGILLSMGSLYFRSIKDLVNSPNSIVQAVLEYDANVGEFTEVFLNELMTILSANEEAQK